MKRDPTQHEMLSIEGRCTLATVKGTLRSRLSENLQPHIHGKRTFQTMRCYPTTPPNPPSVGVLIPV